MPGALSRANHWSQGLSQLSGRTLTVNGAVGEAPSLAVAREVDADGAEVDDGPGLDGGAESAVGVGDDDPPDGKAGPAAARSREDGWVAAWRVSP